MLSLLTTPLAAPTTTTFQSFVQTHGKKYADAEYARRESVFSANIAIINAQNEDYAAGRSTWYAAVNKFADLTAEEFAALTKGRAANRPLSEAVPGRELASVGENPQSKDWRTENVVTPVKNQAGCGSCWAFASTEVIESHYAIDAKTAPLVLAPQAPN